MESRSHSNLRTAIFISLIIFTVLFVPRLWEAMNQSVEIDLRYDELLEQIEAGNIDSITFESDGPISGGFKNQVNSKYRFKSTAIRPSMSNIESFSAKIRDKNPNARIEIAESTSLFGSILFMFIPLLVVAAIIILPLWFIMRQQREMATRGVGFGRSKAKLFQNKDRKTFADVAGVEEAKEELLEVIEFLKNPQKFQKLGGRIPKGILLVGPPGSGKTLLAKAVAGEADVPFFSVAGSDFIEMFVGVGASRVRDLFDQGEKNAPCIVFIDEIDAIGQHRGNGLINGGHNEREQTLDQLLVEMDGFESNSGVIIMAATNRPQVLDPALMRPGRFDRQVVIDKPDVRGRLEILKVHTRRVPLHENVNLSDIARGTVGLTGADLANLVNEAALIASRDNGKSVEMKHLERAKDKIIMGTERKSVLISADEKRVTAIHETGHTVVAMNLSDADPVHKVTIIPRGMSMGSTHQLPTDDKHNFTQRYLENKIAILLAGRVAEKIFASQATTGASNDFEVATDLASRMVCEWGMSSLGPRKFSSRIESMFLEGGGTEGIKDCSEETMRKIDAAIDQIITDGVETAERILKDNSTLAVKMVLSLIEKETLNAEDIEALRQSQPSTSG